jgi:hypothetical protein
MFPNDIPMTILKRIETFGSKTHLFNLTYKLDLNLPTLVHNWFKGGFIGSSMERCDAKFQSTVPSVPRVSQFKSNIFWD